MCAPVLGGSWVVTSGVISRVTIVITHIRGLITPLITTHEPPSKLQTVLSCLLNCSLKEPLCNTSV